MEKILTEALINDLALDFKLEPKVIKAVFKVESSGSGFDSTSGRIKIQFEPHIFKRETGKTIDNGVDLQGAEWKAFNDAFTINPEAAMLSTSWGLGQIMGFNHEAAGYKTGGEMIDMFKVSEYYQAAGMLSFIKSYKRMFEALLKKDWAIFARYYNGINFHKFNYDVRLADAYKHVA